MVREAGSSSSGLAFPSIPTRIAEGLSIADQQIIEIAKAISLDAKVLVMDEPTAALSGVEVERLFAVARGLRDKGTGILFISHRFDEVFDLCDRITVMRDGRYIATHRTADVTVAEIVREMVGRDIEALFPKTAAEIGDAVLKVDGLSRAGVFRDISFEVRAGEIVGAGRPGRRRTHRGRARRLRHRPLRRRRISCSGAARSARGTRRPPSPPASGFVPEDRRKQGLVMNLSVARNVTLDPAQQAGDGGPDQRRRASAAPPRTGRKRLQVKAGSQEHAVSTLSGGNQQKVVLAKWLATDPQLLIIDEPTRGIDVGTKSEVHRLISDLAGRGIAILMISSELPEVLGMADRVLVMREGRITAELDRAGANPESVMHAATLPQEEPRELSPGPQEADDDGARRRPPAAPQPPCCGCGNCP